MRIVDVNEFYSPTGGGVRTYIDRKMSILADLGHELIVIAPGREDRVEERPGGGRIVYVRAPAMPLDANYGLFWDAAPINALLDQLDPDVIENCSPWRVAWVVGARRGRAVKSFFMHNDNVEAYAKTYLERWASGDRVERAFGWYNRYMAGFLDQFVAEIGQDAHLAIDIGAHAAAGRRIEFVDVDDAHRAPSSRSGRSRRARADTGRGWWSR